MPKEETTERKPFGGETRPLTTHDLDDIASYVKEKNKSSSSSSSSSRSKSAKSKGASK